MADKPGIRHYRIGEYAKKMGVTPDLLKHYEKIGLLKAQTSENGYRYYPFSESVALLECFSLRNYDMPLQQIRDLMYGGSLTDLREALAERAEALRRRAAMEQAMVREYEAFDRLLKRMDGRGVYMLIEEREGVYFLPHSKRHDFLEDSRIQEILPRWIEWMPLVKSCRRIGYQADRDCLREAYWGLAVPETPAKEHGIPINGAVEYLPGGRRMICHYRLELTPELSPNAVWDRVQKEISRSGITPSGPVLQTVYVSLFSPDSRMTCGSYSVPIP